MLIDLFRRNGEHEGTGIFWHLHLYRAISTPVIRDSLNEPRIIPSFVHQGKTDQPVYRRQNLLRRAMLKMEHAREVEASERKPFRGQRDGVMTICQLGAMR